ncbi:hypothetical protein M422DRAFT_246164 [Sphaerobolus stellatus SS14]|nr:hypothetical protein M422DRAFT_246164 [Sphaerobolus stellatus SS14]
MPVIIIMARDSLYPKVQSACAQITAHKAKPIIIYATTTRLSPHPRAEDSGLLAGAY